MLVELRRPNGNLQSGEDRTQACIFCSGRDPSRNCVRNQRNLARRQTQPVICHRARESIAILDDVEPVHRVFRRTDATPKTESARRCDVAFAAIEEIVVERQNYVGAFDPGNKAQIVAETNLGGEILGLAPKRIVNTPAHAREHFLQFAANSFPRGRMRFFNQKGQAGAVSHFLAQIDKIFFKGRRGAGLAILSNAFCSQRVVKLVNGSLHENVAGTVARRMKRIAVELNWPAIDRRDKKGNRSVPSRHGGAVVEELSWNGPLDRFGKRNQMHFRPATTAHAKSSQRDGRAH